MGDWLSALYQLFAFYRWELQSHMALALKMTMDIESIFGISFDSMVIRLTWLEANNMGP